MKPMNNEVREQLADYAHAAWSGWMEYLFSKCLNGSVIEGSVVIPPEYVERWVRQMNTPYAELPEHEKHSDRDEADRMIAIFEAQR